MPAVDDNSDNPFLPSSNTLMMIVATPSSLWTQLWACSECLNWGFIRWKEKICPYIKERRPCAHIILLIYSSPSCVQYLKNRYSFYARADGYICNVRSFIIAFSSSCLRSNSADGCNYWTAAGCRTNLIARMGGAFVWQNSTLLATTLKDCLDLFLS